MDPKVTCSSKRWEVPSAVMVDASSSMVCDKSRARARSLSENIRAKSSIKRRCSSVNASHRWGRSLSGDAYSQLSTVTGTDSRRSAVPRARKRRWRGTRRIVLEMTRCARESSRTQRKRNSVGYWMIGIAVGGDPWTVGAIPALKMTHSDQDFFGSAIRPNTSPATAPEYM